MKRILALSLAFCLTFSMMVSATYEESEIQAYDFNQPVNRVMLDRNNPEQPIEEQEDAYFNDPYYSEQWYIPATNSSSAWENLTEDYSVIVAVVDTGVDYTHEDLENRVLYDLGYDFVNDDDDAMDDNGHGTHVSGIIAAEANNDIGITGIVGELDVSILPIKVLDSDGSGSTDDITSGILYAVDMGADVINLSLGSNYVSEDIRTAIQTALDADIFIVVASGNDSEMCSPTSLANLEGVFTVSAVNEQDILAYFSNYGDCVDAYAPGTSILSTYLDNEYAYQDGTSMAAPIVSAAAAIMLSQDPDLDIATISDLLSFSDDTVDNGQNATQPTITEPNMPEQTTPQQTIGQPTVTQPIITQPIITVPNTQQNTQMGRFSISAIGMTSPMLQAVSQTSTNCSSINIYNALLSLYNLD